jgi:hypothetical protein
MQKPEKDCEKLLHSGINLLGDGQLFGAASYA